MKMRGKLLGAAITAAAVNTAVTCELSAQSERDVAFSSELNKMQMYDYSEMHLKKAIEDKPEDVDRLKFQLAETYILMNKQPDAVKIITSIPDSSPYSVPGHAQVGVSLLKRGNYNDAITSLEKVLAFYKANKEKQDAVTQYNESLQYLLVAYRETKQAPKMKELQELLTADMDPRAARYTKCMIDLDAAETLKANPKKEEPAAPPATTTPAKPMTDAEKKAAADKDAAAKKLVDGVAKAFDNRATVNKKSPEYLELIKVNRNDWVSLARNVVLSLQDNMWSMDNVAALSNVATARALVLLEKYDEALKELNTFKELFEACDASFKDQKIPLGESPGAGALYWQGVIYYIKYTNAKTPEEGVKDLKRAFISYGKLLKNYPGFQPNLANKAYAQFLKICDELSEKDPSIAAKVAEEKAKVPAPESAGDAVEGEIENIMPGEAEQLFNNKRFADVIKILTPIVIEKRNHPGLPPLIQALSCSLAQTGDELTALALADYLAMRFPKSEYTPLTLAQTAQIIWTKNKSRRDDAIYLYSLLLKVAPASQWSCDAATMIGQEYFNRAVALALEANKLSGDAKKDKRDESFAMFKKSIEAFDVIIEKYANNKERVQLAYLKTASAYVSLEDYEKAAETYKLYCQSEPENMVNLASAKINITDNLFRAAQEYEKKARDLREAAAAMADDETAPAENAEGKTEAKAEAKPDQKGDVKQEQKAEEKSGDNQVEQTAAPAVVLTDANSKAGKIAEAKTLDGIAQTMYAEAIQNVNEFLTTWIAQGGVLASVATNPAVVKNIETGYSLRPWLYDASGKKEEAAKDFNDFIKAYPDNKAIPKCMMRLGVIYTELGNDNKASEVLSKLSTDPKLKDTPEGKNAKFYLAKTLYANQSFDKCITIFTEIFNSKELLSNLTVQNLRWIASNLTNCGGQHPKAAAQIAYRASKDLLSRLEKPDMKEWVGSQRAAELSAPNKKAEFASVMNMLKEKLLFDAGMAAYWSEDYKNALDSFNTILENKNTAYFYDVNFARADVYIKMKKYDSAREDYTAITGTATMAKQYSTYNKAQCLIGDSHIEEKNILKAMAAFNIIAAPAFAQDDTFAMKFPNDEAKAKYEKEMEASKEWLEYAIYRAAYCASILGRNDDKAKMTEKYKKNFPEGRFIKDLGKLPPADPQYQQPATP